ncbi:MAG: hypothetical protein ACE5NW_17785 [Acidiferrobacterales bacterium]
MQPPVRRFDAYVALDVRHVAETANVLGVSEFDVFRLAYCFRFERDMRPEL